MARKPSSQPTDAELEVLSILWDAPGPMELGRICEALGGQRGHSVPMTTIATLLGVMLDKRLVKREKGERSYLWSAAVDRDPTRDGIVNKVLKRAFGGSAPLMVASLLRNVEVSDQVREDIRSLLDEDDLDDRVRSGRRKRGGR